MISYYVKWTKQEDDQLNILYNVDLFDIMEISKIIHRSPCSIVGRLLETKYIKTYESARGYTIYIKTPEYKMYMKELYLGRNGAMPYSN